MTASNTKSSRGSPLVDPALAMQCMESTMGYYITLRMVVERKFVHAGEAARKRIAELSAREDLNEVDQFVRLARYRHLADHLQKLKDLLEKSQMSVEELEQMDGVFEMLPGKVRLYYGHLLDEDEELKEMIRSISGAEYQAAYQQAQTIIDSVQDGKSVLSGQSLREEKAGQSIREVLLPVAQDLKNLQNDVE